MSHRVARPRVGHTPRYPSGTLGVPRSRYVGYISVHQNPKSPRIMVRTVNDTATSIPSTALSSETGLFSGACDTTKDSSWLTQHKRERRGLGQICNSRFLHNARLKLGINVVVCYMCIDRRMCPCLFWIHQDKQSQSPPWYSPRCIHLQAISNYTHRKQRVKEPECLIPMSKSLC